MKELTLALEFRSLNMKSEINRIKSYKKLPERFFFLGFCASLSWLRRSNSPVFTEKVKKTWHPSSRRWKLNKVVTPLVSKIKGQVEGLSQLRIKACSIKTFLKESSRYLFKVSRKGSNGQCIPKTRCQIEHSL